MLDSRLKIIEGAIRSSTFSSNEATKVLEGYVLELIEEVRTLRTALQLSENWGDSQHKLYLQEVKRKIEI